ncbi:hypothetical protein [Chamaesiphon minutus]|uniref:hypothetical protein n=1 Tax=Chamaesiphon minutus TaxID=1173032 RepID=UPI0012FC0B03|nr:hypothetical protein [Chamaesiphon minutus]
MVVSTHDPILPLVKRILRLKPWHRFTAAKAATGSTPSMNGGACAPPSGQILTLLI